MNRACRADWWWQEKPSNGRKKGHQREIKHSIAKDVRTLLKVLLQDSFLGRGTL